MTRFFKNIKILFLSLFFLLVITGCALEKESGFNRTMQNLTAHYNILFNAQQIVLQKEELMAQVYQDDFSEILSVYQDTIAKSAAGSKELEAVTTRANDIITLKEQSRYLGDAYFLLGQANYLDSDYFTAVEFFDYVIRSFPENKELRKKAMAWKARSLIKLNQPKKVSGVLDTARQLFDAKKASAEVITGTDLQFNINEGNYEQAEKLAVQAVALAKDKNKRIRWTFILAQIQEANKKPADAYKSYSRVVHSNASFELAFNANLNSLRIEERQDGRPTNRISRLRTLLKDDKNLDFIDQIYFQIGEADLATQKIDEAIDNYKLSVKSSTKNQKQKGLSYLRLADISFKYKTDYIQAKKYYDSTLQNLSPAYPGYQQILKKANNLQLLANRYQLIARQDTLQALAKLSEAERTDRINLMVDQHVIQQETTPAVNPMVNNGNVANAGNRISNSFYFYNPEAVNQGLVSFLQIWGKRRLEDNWRISSRTVATVTSNPNGVNDPDAVVPVQTPLLATPGAGNYRQELVNNIPLTPVQLQQSNAIIFNAYADIAGFYKDILSDNQESINTYEYLLNRFPDNQNLAVIYYSLYRLYTDEHNEPQAEKYKNLLLKNYPETQYTKIILDPEYGRKMLSDDAIQNAFYNSVYDFYRTRQYDQVIAQTDSTLKVNPLNKLAPQFAYLKTIALGHQQKLAPFKQELEQIAAQYPDDRLVTPLVKQHLLFISTNEALIAARPFALIDSDPNDIPFSQDRLQLQQLAANNPRSVPAVPVPVPPVELSAPKNSTLTSAPVTLTNKPDVSLPKNTNFTPVKTVSKIFTLADSTELYFVINVSSMASLAPSRFGIGQFNRANYPDSPIKHQLKEVNQTNQLIYTGRFYTIGEAKEYARRIVPLLPEIMKVPAEKYNFFIISRKNLDKLADSNLLNSYFEFYQANYL